MTDGGGLRERTKRAVRAELTTQAMDLFARKGFDETTVDEIAAEVGISKRSFFRYFPAKEDIVLADIDRLGDRVVAALVDRPCDEPPWDGLAAVLTEWARRIEAETAARLGLVSASATLRARWLAKREQLRARIATTLRDRHPDLDAFTADLLTGAAGAALDAAERERDRSGGGPAQYRRLLDRAFAVARPTVDRPENGGTRPGPRATG